MRVGNSSWIISRRASKNVSKNGGLAINFNIELALDGNCAASVHTVRIDLYRFETDDMASGG